MATDSSDIIMAIFQHFLIPHEMDHIEPNIHKYMKGNE